MYLKRLTDLRQNRGLTQKQVADYLGCQREVYRRYEKGIRSIPVDYVVRLADFYAVSSDYMLNRTNKR